VQTFLHHTPGRAEFSALLTREVIMAEAQALKSQNAPVLQAGQARIAGRLVGLRSRNGQDGRTFYNLFKLPAPDAYSSPQTVEVRSKERLGARDDDLSIVVQVGGYARSYKARDDEGETAQVQTAEVTLTFVAFA
jgi:hypothetical protein